MMESVMAGARPSEEVVGDEDPGDEASNASAVSSVVKEGEKKV